MLITKLVSTLNGLCTKGGTMRFSTENDALDYVIEKTVRDPNNVTGICMTMDRAESKKKFDQWIHLKRFMFSKEEHAALLEKSEIQSVRNHYGNVFVDWVEGRPRRRAIMVVNAAYLTDAINIAKEVDTIGGDKTFSGPGLSSDGKEPATHFWCNWNCSASEYDFFVKHGLMSVYDGNVLTAEKVLELEHLYRIVIDSQNELK